MDNYNDIMKNYMKKPEEENKIEKKHKKKVINKKKMEKLIPFYGVFGRILYDLNKK
tara:strand:- start:3335 stop:3502 length:168 start_codon:yes stop_codon:yes gene_type:complete